MAGQQRVETEVAKDSGCKPFSASLTFIDFCNILASIRRPPASNQPKRKVQKQVIKTQIVDRLAPGENPLPLLRLLVPLLDLERGAYNLGTASLARLFIDVFSLPPAAATLLKGYKNPAAQHSGAVAGDFSSSVFTVLRDRLDIRATLMVSEVNQWLTELHNAAADFASKRAVFACLALKATPLELLWITRIILKDLRLGTPHTLILNAFYPNAGRLAATLFGLKEILCACGVQLLGNDATESSASVERTKINTLANHQLMLFRPFKPMLVNRLKRQDIRARLFASDEADQVYLVEPKLDGERLLCHFRKAHDLESTRIDLYTRRGTDYTPFYGEALNPVLAQHLRGVEVVLDGEVVARNKATQSFLAFGTNRAAARGENADVCLCYVVFDIVWYSNGKNAINLMKYKLSERRDFLARVVDPVPDRLMIMPSRVVHRPEEIDEELDRIIADRGEGVVVKNINSRYLLNDRAAGWYKVKPVFGVFGDTLDLLVIGGYYGEGTRMRQQDSRELCDHVTTFLCAALDKPDFSTGLPTRAISFCRIGSGYSATELSVMRDALRNHLVAYTSADTVPYFFPEREKFGQGDRPDVVVDALEHGFVIELRAAELISGPSFGTKVTLRFPRTVKPYREDKAWHEAMTFSDLQVFVAESAMGTPPRVRKTASPSSVTAVSKINKDGVFEAVDEAPELNDVAPYTACEAVRVELESSCSEKMFPRVVKPPCSRIFAGLRFLVLNVGERKQRFQNRKALKIQDSDKELRPERVRHLIQQRGGVLVNYLQQNDNVYVVALRRDFRTDALFSRFQCPIITDQYIQRCVDSDQLLPLRPLDVICSSAELVEQFSGSYDAYGDAYEEDVEPDTVQLLVNHTTICGTIKKMAPEEQQNFNNVRRTVLASVRSLNCPPLMIKSIGCYAGNCSGVITNCRNVVFLLHTYRCVSTSSSAHASLATVGINNQRPGSRRAAWWAHKITQSHDTMFSSLEIALRHKATILGATFTHACIKATHVVDPCADLPSYFASCSLNLSLSSEPLVALVPPYQLFGAQNSNIQFRTADSVTSEVVTDATSGTWLSKTDYRNEIERLYKAYYQDTEKGLTWVSVNWILDA